MIYTDTTHLVSYMHVCIARLEVCMPLARSELFVPLARSEMCVPQARSELCEHQKHGKEHYSYIA